MNRKFFAAAVFIPMFVFAAMVQIASAAEWIKLPYEAGQRFVVVQGYDAPPTHVGHDLYAIDFSQDGCDAYGKLAVAATAGTVMLAQEAGYNGGYGTQVLVVDASRIVARYAHMIPGSIPTGVANGDAVQQGEPLGEIGDTGLVAGDACPIHPGTHIHFAMDTEAADGSFASFLPEPISNYVGITAGRWYLSDNALAVATLSGATAVANRAASAVLGSSDSDDDGAILGAATSSIPTSPVLSQQAQSSSQSMQVIGGVSASPPAPTPTASAPSQPSENPPENSPIDQSATTTASTTDVAIDTSSSTPTSTSTPPLVITNSSFNSTTLAIDLAWQAATSTATTSASTTTTTAPSIVYQIFSSTSTLASSTFVATTTATNFSYLLAPDDFGSSLQFTIAIASTSDESDAGDVADEDTTIAAAATVPVISLPDWWTVIQPVTDTNSNGSWYDDNWYDLGSGFYGTIRALTLDGFVNSSDYFASHLYLDEYLDPAYSQLNQSYTISDNAPFTDGLRMVTIGGLNIALQPNKYYRLRTYQDFQNRSVILAGTSATGTAMWDGYIYDVGIVRYEYQFYPYLAAVMIPDYPPLLPPNPPPTATAAFDSINSLINISWPRATDPDTTSSLLTYEINVATSTSAGDSGTGAQVFADAGWQSVGKALSTSTPVVFGNAYTIGIRTVDDFGATSTALVVPWSFPAGYVPVPSQLDNSTALAGGDGSAQKITFVATTTVSGIALWTNGEFGGWCCSDSAVSIHPDASGTPGTAPAGNVLAESNTIRVGPYTGAGERIYSFTPPQTLSPGIYWFMVDNPTGLNDIQIFGSPGDSYSDGAWSTAPGQDAYFRIRE